jgi:tRNA(Ile2) C34 agmatinyltransferase TiaS
MLLFNSPKSRLDAYYKQDEYRKLCEKAEKGDRETVIRAGRNDSEEKVSISLDSLSPLPKCPQCGAKKINRAKKCGECGFRF